MVAEFRIPSVATARRVEYQKLQDLAAGGMASVELARAMSGSRTGQIVAIKRLHPHLDREKHFAEMFFDEARITAGLHHPNVVEIYEWNEDSQGRYLALEYVPGDSLLTLIREAKRKSVPIPINLALYILGKTAEGLHAAHELRNEKGELRHLVHRDVTPSNILLSIDGDVKLIDFGVAKARDRLSHTNTGTIKGKFGYMSPEQARGFSVDRRSDVFSMGIVLWETLALKRLFRSESELEILRMIVEDAPKSIREMRADVPESVDAFLMGALARNRDDRLGSCAEFADFVWAAYREQGYGADARTELAAFFRKVLPDRCEAISKLLSGQHEFVELTIAQPASGSFQGVSSQVHVAVSGEVPLVHAHASEGPAQQGHPQAKPEETLGADASASRSQLLVNEGLVLPAATQSKRARATGWTAVMVSFAALGVVALGVGGWWAFLQSRQSFGIVPAILMQDSHHSTAAPPLPITSGTESLRQAQALRIADVPAEVGGQTSATGEVALPSGGRHRGSETDDTQSTVRRRRAHGTVGSSANDEGRIATGRNSNSSEADGTRSATRSVSHRSNLVGDGSGRSSITSTRASESSASSSTRSNAGDAHDAGNNLRPILPGSPAIFTDWHH